MSSPTHTPMFCTKAIGLPPGIPDQHEGGLRSIQKLAPAARTHESGLVQKSDLSTIQSRRTEKAPRTKRKPERPQRDPGNYYRNR